MITSSTSTGGHIVDMVASGSSGDSAGLSSPHTCPPILSSVPLSLCWRQKRGDATKPLLHGDPCWEERKMLRGEMGNQGKLLAHPLGQEQGRLVLPGCPWLRWPEPGPPRDFAKGSSLSVL